MSKKNLSTYERLLQDPERKKNIASEYHELLLSEMILALMEEDNISVRKLAEAAGLSPSIIQDIRSGKRDNLTLKSFADIVSALGYHIVLEKAKNRSHPKKRLRVSGRSRRRKTSKV